MENPQLFMLIVVFAIVFVVITTAKQHRRHAMRTAQRICRGCGASHPGFARFCRRCGRQLG